MFQIRANKKEKDKKEGQTEQPSEEEEEVSVGWIQLLGEQYLAGQVIVRVFLVRDPEHRVSLRRHTFLDTRIQRDLDVIDNPFFQLCSSISFGVNGCELLGMNDRQSTQSWRGFDQLDR